MAATCHRRFPDIARSRPSGLLNQQPLLGFPGTRSSRRPRLIAGAVVGAALITSAIVVDDDLSTRQRFEKFGDERTQVRFARAGCGEQRELRRRLRRKRHRVGFDEGGKLLPKRMNFGSGNQLTLPVAAAAKPQASPVPQSA